MKYKYVGTLNENIADYWGISEHKNKPIVVFEDRVNHVVDRHKDEFGSEVEIMKIYNELDRIIKHPDYVYFNKNKNSLEYYKKNKDNVCVAVRISPGNVLKIRSWFPVKKSKINNRKSKETNTIIE